jgi:NADH:ubiquinone oxidoreductase subunit 6 (subunit J)
MTFSLDTAADQDLLTGAWLVVVIVVAVAQIVLFVAGVLSVLRSPRVTGAGRLVWIAAMFVFPLLGPLAWFFVGRRASADIYRRGV